MPFQQIISNEIQYANKRTPYKKTHFVLPYRAPHRAIKVNKKPTFLKHVENHIGNHSQALICHFKPIINNKIQYLTKRMPEIKKKQN